MWISKKKWNEIGNKLDNLSSLCTHNEIMIQRLSERLSDAETTIKNLIEAHNEIEDEEEYLSLNGIYGRYEIKKRKIKKYNHTMNTSTVPNVTLEELAKLVIDGTPIERTEKVDMTTEYYGRV